MDQDGEWYDADPMGLWEHQGDPLRVGDLMRLLGDLDEALLFQVSVYDGSKPLEPTSPMHIDYGGPLERPDHGHRARHSQVAGDQGSAVASLRSAGYARTPSGPSL